MFKQRTVTASTRVYHGTAATADFDVPTGPAWFTLELERAQRWAGWRAASCLAPGERRVRPRGCKQGVRRVLVYDFAVDIDLVDTESFEDWQKACELLTGGPEPTIGEAVCAWRACRLSGWYGRTEIMLVDTSVVRRTGLLPVGNSVIPYGHTKPITVTLTV